MPRRRSPTSASSSRRDGELTLTARASRASTVERRRARRPAGTLRVADDLRETAPPTERGARGAARAEDEGQRRERRRRAPSCCRTTRPRPEVQLDYPGYRSTRCARPSRPLVTLPEELHRARRARSSATDASASSTTTSRASTTGEPLGERIIVTGRVLDEDGRPVPQHAGRDLAGQRRRAATATTVDQHPAPLDPNFTGAGRCAHRRRRPLPLRHDQAGRLSVGQPRQRLAAGAHPLLAVRPRVRAAARDADVLPRRPALRLRPDLQLGPRPDGARADDLRASTSTTTEPEWALGYRFDIVLRGRDATPMED